MPLTAASNIFSLKAQTQLAKTNRELGKTFERLSSGLRINSPSDDPAGLIVADNLRAQTKIATVALRNANDGISYTSIADAGLAEIGNILSRMAELALQSSNGVYTNSQRSALSSEFLALGSEIERIARTTTFNNINILSNSSNVSIQVGLGGANSTISIGSVIGTLASLGLGNSGGALTFSIIEISETGSNYAAAAAYSVVAAAITSVSSLRGILGASESRLNSAINYLTVLRENFSAAESRIRDADIAEEVAKMVRLQILQQAGTAVIAQANQQPELVLRLLQ